MSTPTRITHLIDGQPWTGTAERTSPVFNPATGEQTGVLDLASAVARRRGRQDAPPAPGSGWADASLAKRTGVLFAFRELLNERKEDIAALITAEHGKVLSDALGEVTRGLEVAEFACGIPHAHAGGFSENASTNVDVYSIRQPLGVVAVISPVQLPGHGADVVHPDRHRVRQRRRAQAVARRTRRRRSPSPRCGRRPGCPTASCRSSTATRRRSTRC